MKAFRVLVPVFSAALLCAASVSFAAEVAVVKGPPPPAPAAKAPPSPNQRDLTKQWGVRVESLRLTAAGNMLDFRYRVTDEKKAAPLFLATDKPYLLHHGSGARMIVPSPPKTGPLRTLDPPKKDHTYFMFFANAGKRVRPGDEVTVVIGKFKAERLKVE